MFISKREMAENDDDDDDGVLAAAIFHYNDCPGFNEGKLFVSNLCTLLL